MDLLVVAPEDGDEPVRCHGHITEIEILQIKHGSGNAPSLPLRWGRGGGGRRCGISVQVGTPVPTAWARRGWQAWASRGCWGVREGVWLFGNFIFFPR